MYICLLLLALIIYCAPAFFAFKNYAHQNNIHFVSSHAWYWCLVGFVVYGVNFNLFRLLSKVTTRSLWLIWASLWSLNFKVRQKFIDWNQSPNKVLTLFSILPLLLPAIICLETNTGFPSWQGELDNVKTSLDNIQTGLQNKQFQI